MSDTTSAFSQFNFAGGIPTSSDFAPSLIFFILYVAIIPLFVFAIIRNKFGIKVLIRPGLFILARLLFFGIRMYLAKNDLTQGLVEADLILVLIGFVFIMEPAVALWKLHVTERALNSGHAAQFTLLSRILRLALLGVIITGIIAGTSISGAIDDPSKVSSVKSTRKICYILSLVVAAVLFLANIGTSFMYGKHLRARISALIGLSTVLLLVISIYRLADSEAGVTSKVASKTVFYILQILLEFIVTIALLMTVIMMKVEMDPSVVVVSQQGQTEDVESQQTKYQGHESSFTRPAGPPPPHVYQPQVYQQQRVQAPAYNMSTRP